MNIFANFTSQNFSKIFSKTHQIASFLKNFLNEHAPKPPPLSKYMYVASLRAAWRKYLTFQRKYFAPPPPEMKS